ncbi:MAG TPA: bifunctional diaminohydroxyphosphoribosylaminopyrimidine deaminase/5-amino-6-(5-phosphoribosylamino)uracil reductase RibD [Acidobacteriota bacterium]|nr:bifunctional diaminohydroxyphosphoribosylaminopyrimidine deaminase/5-amino-6-(5-phosphoribosylamino)uracil reductase RibD [Acidobacteriota bacterium]
MSSGSAGHGDEHLEHIQECLELAAKARGDTGSNPLVGAVVVASGAVIGRGYHRRCGDPHAEQVALVQAGGKARGGTLYTNVEPCCHQGRTPPCVDAIIAAGVGTVVASHSDPDERVDGRGFEALRTAGIEVLVGPLAAEAAELNAAYLKLKRTGRPLVVAKAAVSLDGRMATRTRGSQWITGEEARDFAHQVRGTVDAVVVGIGTLLDDDPRLTARVPGAHPPRYRAVVDARLETPADAKLLQETAGVPLIVTTGAADAGARRHLEARGAQTVEVQATPSGRVDLDEMLVRLGDLEVASILLEGGSALLTSAFELGIIDKVMLFYAPLLIGGQEALPLWGGDGVAELASAPRVQRVRLHRLGSDWAIEGYLQPPELPA